MADNRKLQNAKATKNDEFYTEYNTISNEVGHYREQFEGQTVYCNCDDPASSEFWRYFHSNHRSLKLKKLIATHYSKDSSPSYALIYEGGDDFNMDAGKTVPIEGNGDYFAGDFRSDACLKFLDEATIVVTNPPFSLFREYIAQLVKSAKKFLILGNQNAITYKEVFPLFKENKVWYGASIHSGGIDFRMPDDYEEYSKNVFIRDGHHYINLAGIRWFTNMDVKYRHDGLWHKNGKFDNTQAHRYYEGHEDKYPKYDNYDAIEIGKTSDIPIDYPEIMGVPITWLDKYNPNEFEILGLSSQPNIGTAKRLHDNDYYSGYWRGKVKTRVESNMPLLLSSAFGGTKCVRSGSPDVYQLYWRIFIRNLHPIKKADDLGY